MPEISIDSSNPPLIRQKKVNGVFVDSYEIENRDDNGNFADVIIFSPDIQLLEVSVSLYDPKQNWTLLFTEIIDCCTRSFVIPGSCKAKIKVTVVDIQDPDHAYTIPAQTKSSWVGDNKLVILNKEGILQGY